MRGAARGRGGHGGHGGPVCGPGGRGGAPGRAQREPDGAQRLGAARAAGRGAGVCLGRRGIGAAARGARHGDGARRSDGGARSRRCWASAVGQALALCAAKASVGHSEAPSGQVGLQRLAASLARLAEGGNAQRRLNPLVRERWAGASVALCAQPTRASGDVGGVSSFGYSGTIAHAVLRAASRLALARSSGRVSASRTVGVRSAGRRRPATTAARRRRCTAAAGRFRRRRGSPAGRWLLVEPMAACGAAGSAVRAALPSSSQVSSGRLGGWAAGVAWRGAALLLDAADGASPSARGVRAAVQLVQLLVCGAGAHVSLLLLTSGAVSAAAGAAARPCGAAHGGCWGLARVLRLERPSARVLSVDVVASGASGAAVAALLGEAAVGSAEAEVAWSRGLRHGAAASRRDGGGVGRVGRVGRRRGGALRRRVAADGRAGRARSARRGAARGRGASRLVLSSRSGRVARDGQGLASSLRALAARSAGVSVVACDGGDAAGGGACAGGSPVGGAARGGVRGPVAAQRAARGRCSARSHCGAAHSRPAAARRGPVLVDWRCVGNAGQANYRLATRLDALARPPGARWRQQPAAAMVGGAGMGRRLR